MGSNRLFQQAVAHHRAGDTARAEELYRSVLKRDARHDQAAFLLAGFEIEAGRTAEAIRLLAGAVRLVPRQPAYHANLGEAYRRERKFEAALAAFDNASALKPDLPEVHLNRGLALAELDRLSEALSAFERCVALKPTVRGAWFRLASTAWELGEIDRALELYRNALELFPDAPELHNGVAVALKDTGRIDLALSHYRRAVALAPNQAAFHGNLVYALSFDPESSDAGILEEARRFARRHAEPVPRFAPRATVSHDSARALRVGYVAPTFSDHIIGRLLQPLFQHRDRSEHEVHCYSDVRFPDSRTQRLRELADGFRDIVGKSDAEVAELVRADGIDVLIDANMHMAHSRLGVFARRPARVQAAWLAYPGTTGLSAIDYRIGDPHLDPQGTEGNYSEHTLRLPDAFWCYDPLSAEPPDVGPLPLLEAKRVTFGCLSNFCKLNPGVLGVWARILTQLPSSRLLLLCPTQAGRRWFSEGLKAAGVDPERVEFVGFQSRATYLASYRRIDVGLDTFPYNGHTTSLDSFWMGVPVVTLSGPTVAGRAGACLARNLGLPELVAEREDDYVRLALELARDEARLTALRSGLRARMQASPLMDHPRFARNFAALLREIWRLGPSEAAAHDGAEAAVR